MTQEKDLSLINKAAGKLAEDAEKLANKISSLANQAHEVGSTAATMPSDNFVQYLTIFVLACFVGYYVVWKVTPALHTPLMAVTNAISGIIIVGAMIAMGPEEFDFTQLAGFIAVVIASVNIFGGFIVTYRMLEMFKKK